jgi:hypothetical protein
MAAMSDLELRLECLRIAMGTCRVQGQELELAKQFYNWVKGQ